MATHTHPGILSTEDGIKYFSPDREAAFFGFLQAHVELVRSLESALASEHGCSLAGYELLSRLARADDGRLRIGDLASHTTLSLSRVSRLVDDLALRGLVERRQCASDRRVSHATLVPAGRAFLREAQETFHAVAHERFLGRLSERETQLLADVFGRIASGGEECRSVLAADPA